MLKPRLRSNIFKLRLVQVIFFASRRDLFDVTGFEDVRKLKEKLMISICGIDMT